MTGFLAYWLVGVLFVVFSTDSDTAVLQDSIKGHSDLVAGTAVLAALLVASLVWPLVLLYAIIEYLARGL